MKVEQVLCGMLCAFLRAGAHSYQKAIFKYALGLKRRPCGKIDETAVETVCQCNNPGKFFAPHHPAVLRALKQSA